MKLKLYFVAPFILQATLWRIVMRPFFNFFAHFEVKGLENLENLKGPVIFAPNHSSELDAILLPLALPIWSRFEPMFYVVRERKYYAHNDFNWRRHLYQGWVFKLLGAFPIKSGVQDYSISLKDHIQILRDGGSVCIFPEGSVTKDGNIGNAHGGVSYLAAKTNTLIVPVFINGTFRLTLSQLILRRSKFTLNFHSCIEVSNHTHETPEDYRNTAQRVLDVLRSSKHHSYSALNSLGT